MAQFLRPDSNVTQTSFTGGFAEIDEATASDADFAYGANNTAAVLEVGLSNPAATPDPAGTSTVRYRIAKTNNGTVDGAGNAVTVTAGVYQGGTLIQAGAAQTATGTWTGYDFTFTHGSITDWTDVRLRFTTSASGGSPANRRGGAVSWAEIEAPDAAPQALTLTADLGAFTWTGVTANFFANKLLSADLGTFTHTGIAAGLFKGRILTADTGTFTWTGVNADLIYGQIKQIIADVEAFTWTGIDAGILHNALITGDTRSYAWTGIDATLSSGKRLVAEVGSFALTGINNAFARTRVLAGDVGSFTVTGINASTVRTVLLSSSTRQYLVNGLNANLSYSGSGPPPSTVKKLKYSFGLEELHQIRIGEALDNGGLIYRAGGIYRIL